LAIITTAIEVSAQPGPPFDGGPGPGFDPPIVRPRPPIRRPLPPPVFRRPRPLPPPIARRRPPRPAPGVQIRIRF
jgi:hypothetical protein